MSTTRREPRPTKRLMLTDMSIKNAEPDVLPRAIYDTKNPNLVLMVHPSGSKAYKVRYSRHGRARWFHIGNVGAIFLSDARKKAAEIMLRVANDEDPHQDRRARRGAGTFGELVARYVEERGTKSIAQYEAQLRKHALPLWGRLPAGAVTKADVSALFDQRRKEAPGAAKLLLAAISGAFAWGLFKNWEGLSVNPAHNIASSKFDESLKADSRERVLTDAEVVSFWHQWPQAGLLKCMALRVILLCGQRPGEVAHMRLEDIDGNWWTLQGKPTGNWPGTKNHSTHRVWLTDTVLDMIHDVAGTRRTGLVFRTPQGNAVGSLDGAMRGACEALGIADKATPHDLRRTHGTLITRLGFTRAQMDRIQNHLEGGIGAIYDRNTYAAEAQAIQERVGAHIAGLLAGGGGSAVIDLASRR